MKLRHLLTIAAALFLLIPGPATAEDFADHSLITPYPGSTGIQRIDGEFGELMLPAGRINYQRATRGAVLTKKVAVSGKVTGLEYRSPKERTALEVMTNYRQALEKSGFEILFFCREKQCGTGSFETTYLRRKIGGGAPKTGFLTAKLTRPEGDVYMLIGVDQQNGYTRFVIVEGKPMEQGLVKVDADVLLAEIDRTGHASIYGILFETGQAIVSPESKQALGEIAKLLEKRASLKLYVVGHTDNEGRYDFNQELSLRRATAVVTILTKDYGVSGSRLQPAGVGPLSPVLANTTSDGRARNRRVELVAQ